MLQKNYPWTKDKTTPTPPPTRRANVKSVTQAPGRLGWLHAAPAYILTRCLGHISQNANASACSLDHLSPKYRQKQEFDVTRREGVPSVSLLCATGGNYSQLTKRVFGRSLIICLGIYLPLVEINPSPMPSRMYIRILNPFSPGLADNEWPSWHRAIVSTEKDTLDNYWIVILYQ